MNAIQHSVIRLALAAFIISGCSSTPIEDGLSAAERDAARGIPGTGSAVTNFRGVDYAGAFILDVTGDTVSFYISGHDSTLTSGLSGRVMLPNDFSRDADGSIDVRFGGPADGSAGFIQVNSNAPVGYPVVSVEVRTDATGLVSARIVGVRLPDNDTSGLEIPGTGGERETLTVSGHLTATCNIRLPSNDVIPDPEHTTNPRCAELLRGL